MEGVKEAPLHHFMEEGEKGAGGKASWGREDAQGSCK